MDYTITIVNQKHFIYGNRNSIAIDLHADAKMP